MATFNEALELAVKASNNSLYGILVQVHCVIYNPDMANAITQLSRDLNVRMTNFVMTHNFVEGIGDLGRRAVYEGMRPDIVYGDTDSIFVVLRFAKAVTEANGDDMRRLAPFMFHRMATILNKVLFRTPNVMLSYRDDPDSPVDQDGPIQVNVDKVCAPYYQSPKKKMYFHVELDMETGEPIIGANGKPVIKVTGGQGKKRDAPPILEAIETDLFKAILEHTDMELLAIRERVCSTIRSWVQKIVDDMVPWDMYIASTKLTKEAKEYASPNVATVLSQKLVERDPARKVAVGDRFPYLVVEVPGWRGMKKRDMCEVRRTAPPQCCCVMPQAPRVGPYTRPASTGRTRRTCSRTTSASTASMCLRTCSGRCSQSLWTSGASWRRSSRYS